MSRQDAVLLAIIALMGLVRLLGATATKRFLVRRLGLAEYRSRGSQERRRRRTQALAAAYGDGMSEARIRDVVEATFIEKWRETFFLLPTHGERRALKGADVEGLDRLEEAIQRGNGVILWENVSYGQRLLAPQILSANGFDIVQIHGAGHRGEFSQKPPTWIETRLVRPFYERCERAFVEDIIYLPVAPALAFTRAMRTLLDGNAILCIPSDGTWGMKRLKLTLMGSTIYLSTGMLSLTKATGATLLPMFYVPSGTGRSRLVIERPIVVERGGDRNESLKAAGAEYLAVWESYIREYPEQFRGWGNLGRHDEARQVDAS